MSKALYLWYMNQRTPYMIVTGTFGDVVAKAASVITDKSIDDRVFVCLGNHQRAGPRTRRRQAQNKPNPG